MGSEFFDQLTSYEAEAFTRSKRPGRDSLSTSLLIEDRRVTNIEKREFQAPLITICAGH